MTDADTPSDAPGADDFDVAAAGPHARTIERKQFPCKNCGAGMEFIPGTRNLRCPYCGTEQSIAVDANAPQTGNNDSPDGSPASEPKLKELDFLSYLERAEAEQAKPRTVHLTHCEGCGADISLSDGMSAELCPYCGLPVVSQDYVTTEIAVQGVLPFAIEKEKAYQLFYDWLKGLWFAPNDLVKMTTREGVLNGIYMPYWTYDSDTLTDYVGERGEYYYTTETYTAMENGRAVTRSRQVRHTRWYPASGEVRVAFDDVLVAATKSLPQATLDSLEPWDLDKLVDFTAAYLSGYRAETYKVALKEGFAIAKEKMLPAIDNAIRRDIGGDEQRIHSRDTDYRDTTFKHILLPLWISAYRYDQRTFRFAINGRSGKVQGERPYSWVKITLFVIFCLALLVGVVYLMNEAGMLQ